MVWSMAGLDDSRFRPYLRQRGNLLNTYIAAAVVIAGSSGCGSSGGPAAAQRTCERNWTPAASSRGSFKIATLVKAAGQPDSREPTDLKDVYGKPIGYERWTWNDGNGTSVLVKDGVVSVAVCDLKHTREQMQDYLNQ